MKNSELNVLALAYIGDAIYEIYIRKYLIEKGIIKVKDLQQEATKFVSAKGQAKYLKKMIESDFFNQEEMDIIYRARNNKGSSHPKNTDIITYKYATGLEALIGCLFLDQNIERINQIMHLIVGEQ